MAGRSFPEILYTDADAGIAWLARALGFKAGEVYRDDDGTIQHAELDLDGATVMIASAGVGREPFSALPAGGTLVYTAVDEVDPLYERCKEAGADIALELTETDYGSRDFTVRDPEGNLWAFGTYRPSSG